MLIDLASPRLVIALHSAALTNKEKESESDWAEPNQFDSKNNHQIGDGIIYIYIYIYKDERMWLIESGCH